MVHAKKDIAEALAAPFEFPADEDEEAIKLTGLELVCVVLHTTPEKSIKDSCGEVRFYRDFCAL